MQLKESKMRLRDSHKHARSNASAEPQLPASELRGSGIFIKPGEADVLINVNNAFTVFNKNQSDAPALVAPQVCLPELPSKHWNTGLLPTSEPVIGTIR